MMMMSRRQWLTTVAVVPLMASFAPRESPHDPRRPIFGAAHRDGRIVMFHPVAFATLMHPGGDRCDLARDAAGEWYTVRGVIRVTYTWHAPQVVG